MRINPPPSHTAQKRAQTVGLCILLIAALVFSLVPIGLFSLSSPQNAYAATTAKFNTVMVTASGKDYQMYQRSDGALAYCYDPGNEPPTTAATYTLTSKKDPIAAYIVAKGYPFTRDIAGETWNKGQAQCITQIALWFYRSYGSDPDNYYTGCDSYMKTLFHDASLVDAALSLCKKALKYDGSDASINGCITIWKSSDSSMQDTVLVGDMTGTCSVKKTSSDTTITGKNDCYSLTGATFGVYSDSACKTQVDTLTTKADGTTANSKELAEGTYYLKETKAPEGFIADDTVHKVTVSAGENKAVAISDKPAFAKADLLLQKLDAETGQASPLAAATLANAQFSVTHYGGYFSSAADAQKAGTKLRSWVFATDKTGKVSIADADAKVSGDNLYTFGGAVGLPLGTYVIAETQAPEGYVTTEEPILLVVKPDGKSSCTVQNGDGITVSTCSNLKSYTIPEQLIRGNLAFTKAHLTEEDPLANCAFLLTSVTTGEPHVLVTNEEGRFDSSTLPAAQNTNANDAAVTGYAISPDDEGLFTSVDISAVEVHDELLTSDCGLWFGRDAQGGALAPQESLASLPYDRYLLTELPCQANSRKALGRDVILYASDEAIFISQNNVTVDAGTIVNDSLPLPTLKTLLLQTGSDAKETALKTSGETRLTDVVSYQDLRNGVTYRFTSLLFDTQTNLPLLRPEVTKALTAKKLQTEITKVYQALGITTPVPEIVYKTKSDGTKEIAVKNESEVKDVVLICTGEPAYQLLTTLLEKDSLLAPYLIAATTDYAGETSEGTLGINLPAFNSEQLAGKSVVCFEALTVASTETVDAVEVNEGNKDQQIAFDEDEPEPGLPKTGVAFAGAIVLALGALVVGSTLIARSRRR